MDISVDLWKSYLGTDEIRNLADAATPSHIVLHPKFLKWCGLIVLSTHHNTRRRPLKARGRKGSRQLKTGNSLIKDFQIQKKQVTGVGTFSKNGEISQSASAVDSSSGWILFPWIELWNMERYSIAWVWGF